MYQTLINAPFEKSLILVKVADQSLALRFRNMGIFEGMELIRVNEDVKLHPVRVEGSKGVAIIGGGMSSKIIVLLNDGRKSSLSEMEPDETGFIAGLTGGSGLSGALKVLGFEKNKKITLIRRLPPMEYITFIEKKGKIRLTESMAAKIWGEMDKKMCQFNFAQKKKKFFVKSILGGQNAFEMLRSRGVETETILTLEGVTPARNLYMCKKNPIIISTKDGLRLFLKEKDCEQIFIKEK